MELLCYYTMNYLLEENMLYKEQQYECRVL